MTAAPANTSPPTIPGTPQQGVMVTETGDTWTNNPTSFSYQWERCDSKGTCTPIQDATQQSYTPTADDVGDTLKVQESATNAGGTSGIVSSDPSPVVLQAPPVNTSVPEISVDSDGTTLIESGDAWTNRPTVTYQWERCDSVTSPDSCVLIDGATGQSYTPTSDDAGHTIVVEAVATNGGGSSTEQSDPAPPTNLSPPTITGSAQAGQTLTAVQGIWTGAPSDYEYQWFDCDSSFDNCTEIATGQTYTVADSDVGQNIVVVEIANNASNDAGPGLAASDPTASVTPTDNGGGTSEGAASGGETSSGSSSGGGNQTTTTSTTPTTTTTSSTTTTTSQPATHSHPTQPSTRPKPKVTHHKKRHHKPKKHKKHHAPKKVAPHKPRR
jgi:hypothetical protein